ncbi:hypothetical protein F2Q70_00044075 [Brassica cretica]|uniref:proline--tRNA ligase n=1 Tax=Brassica cretica TaxID=69181 RepID=A0A8S9KH37_BRACR|nr:hypothetical protein F2Q70_00044075 [Brassica cretica]
MEALRFTAQVLGFSVSSPRSMEKKFDKKFTWVIKDFSSLQSVNILSDIFVVRGCKWQLNAYKGNKVQNFLSLFLEVAGYGSLPSGWRRHARFRLIVVNQRSETLSRQLEGQNWFEEKANGWGFQSMLSLDEINAKDSGFLVNKELKIVVEIELLEVIGKVDVNGFHLLSSEVESVSRMFEKHPETASEVHLKNPNLRTGYMSLLLSLIDTLCQSPHKLPKDDLGEAYYALESLTDAGFKLDWLEKKISQVSERKEKEKDGEIQCQAVKTALQGAGVRALVDERDNYACGWKYADWEMKGVPLRIELGPRDLEKNQVRVVRRDTGAKMDVLRVDLVEKVKDLLEVIQRDLYDVAKRKLEECIQKVETWDEFKEALRLKKLVLAMKQELRLDVLL